MKNKITKSTLKDTKAEYAQSSETLNEAPNTKKTLLVDIAESLIRESERIYLGKKKATIPGQDFFRRYFLYPISMISRGFDFAKKEFWVYSILYILGIYGTVILLQELPNEYPAEIRTIISSVLLSSAMFFPLFIAMFLPPSTFSNSRINRDLINSLVPKFEDTNAEGLEKVLLVHQDRIDKRILLIKRLYALGWALFVYLAKQLSSWQASELVTPSERDLFTFTLYGMMIFIGFLCIQAYSKSAETIITNTKLALFERENL